MLNRKLSNYIFQGTLVLILAVVLIARSVIIGNIDSSIEEKSSSNKVLQRQINIKETIVEENKGKQANHLYELYHKVPSYYSQEELEFEVYSYLYLIGLDYQNIYESNIEISNYADISRFSSLSSQYVIKSVSLEFNAFNQDNVETIIFELINSDQMFMINSLEYDTPNGSDFSIVSLTFLAFYNIEEGS